MAAAAGLAFAFGLAGGAGTALAGGATVAAGVFAAGRGSTGAAACWASRVAASGGDCTGGTAFVGSAALTLTKPLGQLLPALLADSGITLLPIEIADVARVAALSFHHRDPFDRLLVAQALERDLAIVLRWTRTVFDAFGS